MFLNTKACLNVVYGLFAFFSTVVPWRQECVCVWTYFARRSSVGCPLLFGLSRWSSSQHFDHVQRCTARTVQPISKIPERQRHNFWATHSPIFNFNGNRLWSQRRSESEDKLEGNSESANLRRGQQFTFIQHVNTHSPISLGIFPKILEIW